MLDRFIKYFYHAGMTIEEINAALVSLGWTKKELAERLHIHPVTLNLILSGKNKLTDQLAAHIELLLKDQQEQLLIFKVSYPDALCERWVPGWERLTEEQRVQAVEAVLQSAAEQLAADYERTLTPEDREMIHYFLGGLRGPAREFDLDAEEAAELPDVVEVVAPDYRESYRGGRRVLDMVMMAVPKLSDEEKGKA